jgi:hypothetical protein
VGGRAHKTRLRSGDPVIEESGDRKAKSNPTPGAELCKRFGILVEGWGEGQIAGPDIQVLRFLIPF